MDDPMDNSLGDAATYAGAKGRPARDEVSLGDERTLGGGDAADLDTLIDDIEVVDLEGRYKVEGTLGQGGMGAVLLATDTRLGRKVAIKRILGEAARSKTAIMRFLTEAKAIAALNHPNIVQIYDYGRAKDGPFLIMEYVDGGSLADRCKQGAIPLEEAIALACQICDGLAKAHDAGIVHRDIKPANVLLNRDNLPKLTDFGLAKAEAADHGMTMTGAVMGTPDFMPPEQRRDASLVDHRSDLWSLAASLYQMVTGRSPKIIRFNDVPAVLQDVLARALEEEKDARYQSARELRDALRTSVRAASVAVEELAQGQCPACGVKNDASRRFCRGCGESLEAPCLACTKPMPMWEEICGSCGAKQTSLLDERRQAMAARQAEAEGLLGEFEFDRATEVATQLRDTSHPKLRHLTGWTTSFFERVEASRAEQTRHAVEVLAEAGKHEAAHDYLSAAFALETIPEVMRSSLIPGTRESAGRMLERIRKVQADVRRLESLVRERLAAKQFDDLLPDVDKLLTLRPDRADIRKVRTQLVERQQKQAGHRDKAIETARASLAEHDYEAALAGLSSVAAAAVTPEVVKLREQAEELVRKVRSLAKKIKDKVAAKDLDGLIGTVEQYLALKPADGEHVALRQSLAAREEKIAGEITARCEQAAALEKACRFDDAIKLLGAIPESRRSEAVLELLDRASRRATWRRSAMTALGAATPQTFEAAIAIGRDYAAAIDSGNLSDTDFTALLQKVEAARDRAVQSRRLKLVTGAAAAGIAAVVAIVVAGMWIRSAVKTASVARAIEQGRWDDALAMSPDNTTALVGRARVKLQATPPDVDGAFADLDRAEVAGRSSPDTEAVRGDAHAVRAGGLARTDRLDVAARDLSEAKRLGGSAELVAAAQEAVVAGWVARAQAASDARDLPRLQKAVAAALGASRSNDAVSPLLARVFMLEAVALAGTGDMHNAKSKAIEATLLDTTGAAAATLKQQTNQALRAVVVADYRQRLEAHLSGGDWRSAMRSAAAGLALETTAATWVREAIASQPGGVSSVPIEVLGEFPAVACALPPLRNSIGVELRLLPAGTFTMGQAGGSSDETPHSVTLTQPFFVGVQEVTNAQWKSVMGSVPSKWKEDARPVEQVSWQEAVDFCRKLSALPEERNAGRVYRLPTEAEWEYACRAGTTTQYSFGDDASQLGEYAWYDGNSGNQTHPVGTKKPNAWGIYDMHGNVDEWCHDSYSRNYPKGAVTDPQGALRPRKRIAPWSFLDPPPVVSVAALAAMSAYVGTGAMIGLPVAQVTLTELQATQQARQQMEQARQQMEANAAGAAASARPQMNPNNAEPAGNHFPALRGGSWYGGAGFCRSAFRREFAPSRRNYYLGFRLAMTPPGAAPQVTSGATSASARASQSAVPVLAPAPVFAPAPE